MVFLTATITYTYVYSRDVILNEANTSIRNTAKLLRAGIEQEKSELVRYANVVRDDLRMREYMFMTVSIGTDSDALMQLFERQFAWLPASYRVIVSQNGQILSDEGYPALAKALMQQLNNSSDNYSFYFHDERGLHAVTWAPIEYEGALLGAIGLAHVLDKTWLDQHRQYSKGHLFIEQNGKIYLSTLPDLAGKSFIPESGHIKLNDESFRVVPIPLPGSSEETPKLWHGVSEENILYHLSHHSQVVLSLAIVGCIAILAMGLMIVREFNKPLCDLMKIIQAVSEGKLPHMGKYKAHNQISVLANRFSEMLQTLRVKQEEIDNIHRQLKQSSITDALTQLYNRRHLDELFPKLMAQANRDSHFLWGMLFDLDYFKNINDQHGHLAGDQCLLHFSHILRDNCRANDYVFRLGGEEFFLLSINDSKDGGEALAEKIRITLDNSTAEYNGQRLHVTTSVGVACADQKLNATDALKKLLLEGDEMMYQAKQEGRNCTRVLPVFRCCVIPQQA